MFSKIVLFFIKRNIKKLEKLEQESLEYLKVVDIDLEEEAILKEIQLELSKLRQRKALIELEMINRGLK